MKIYPIIYKTLNWIAYYYALICFIDFYKYCDPWEYYWHSFQRTFALWWRVDSRSLLGGCVERIGGGFDFDIDPIFFHTRSPAHTSYLAHRTRSRPMISASRSWSREWDSCQRLFPTVRAVTAPILPVLAQTSPITALVPICSRTRLNPWSLRAWAISCPMITAISSSVRRSLSMIPVYIAIFPPGMQNALIISFSITFTSQCIRCLIDAGISGSDATALVSREVISRTRRTVGWLSGNIRSCSIIAPYWAHAILSTSVGERSIYCAYPTAAWVSMRRL